MLIDSHAHLCSDAFDADIEGVLSRAREAGVETIVNISTTPDELERGLQIPSLLHVGATTPHDVEKWGEAHFGPFERAARSGKLVAIGETGLDYHYEHSDRTLQQTFLRRYLELAMAVDLPVVIHCREAFADLFAILDEVYTGKPGILHCFTGTLEEAHGVIERGWFLSLSGIATFKKSEELRQVAVAIPLEHLLIETDAPYLAPPPYRGKRNEPAYLVETAKCLAATCGLPFDEFASATSANARRAFNL